MVSFTASARLTAATTLARRPSSCGVTVQVFPDAFTVIGALSNSWAPARTAAIASGWVISPTSIPATVTPGRIVSARACSYR